MREAYEPPGLRELIDSMSYKPNWLLSLELDFQDDGSGGLVFQVVSHTDDSIRTGNKIRVRHQFLVPPATYNRDNWAAWLVDRLGDVEMHERNEFVKFNGVREFAPHHGNGEDPYRTWHISDYATAKKRAGDE